MTTVVAVSGGLREPSSTRLLTDRLTDAVRAELGRAGAEVSTTVVELRPLARQITDAMLSGYAQHELEAAFEAVAAADGLIAVTPVFNASYSGLFKSFFDVLPDGSLTGVPVLPGATGGTERHQLLLDHGLRPLFSYLHAVVSPTGVYAATSDFGARDGTTSPLDERIARAARDFVRLVRCCGRRPRRDDWDEDVAAMQHLLTGPEDLGVSGDGGG